MAVTLNDLLQYMHMNNLLIHNLPGLPYDEVKDLKGTEFTKKVVESINKLITLNEPLSHKDIDTSHFYGKKPTETKNVVIVRFIRRDLKNEVFFNKSQLKKFNKDNQIKVGITDHLTRYNKGLYDHATGAWPEECLD